MGLYEVHFLSMSLLRFGMGTMLANFHMSGIMLLLRAVVNMRNASPSGPMCFRCLIFEFVRTCVLLCLLWFIAYWTLFVVCVILYSCCFALSMDFFVACVACLTEFVNCSLILHITCSSNAFCPLVWCACLPSVMVVKHCWQCVYWWVWWSEQNRTLCLP